MTTNDRDAMNRINGAFALLIYALSRNHQVKRANELVKCIQRLYDNDTIHLYPNTTALNAMLNLWAREGQVDKVLSLLEHMMKAQENGRHAIAPNNVSFNSAVLACAKRGDPKGASKIVHLMSNRYKQKTLMQPPDIVTFNGLLDAWAKSGDRNAGERAEEVLQWMERERVHPDTRSYNHVIDAYSKSQKPLRAEGILRHLIHLREQGSEVGPDDYSFTAVVHSWTRNNDESVNSTERAAAIIQLMESLQDSGYDGIAFDVAPYNALINVWAASSDANRGENAKDVLEHMKSRPGVVPNSRTYSSIITALVKSGKTGIDEALHFLCDMEDRLDAGDRTVILDTACYNAVLSGWIHSEQRDAFPDAEQLWQRVLRRQQQTRNHEFGPNTVTYNLMMNILAKARMDDSAERAEGLLNEMESLYESGNQQVKPSAVSYVICISAWAKSNDREKVPRAQAILRRMKEAYRCGNLDAKPTLSANNALLNACGFPVGGPNERSHAATVVMETLKELDESNDISADHVSYATALKAFGRCIPPGKSRDDLVEREFQKCCIEGLVNDFVLRELERASLTVHSKLFGSEDSLHTIMKKVPREWRRNVSSRAKQ